MGKVWIQAKAILNVEDGGKMKRIHPGDWVEVGQHDARRWLAEGKCVIHQISARETVQDLFDCAISLRNGDAETVRNRYPGLDITEDGGFHAPRMLFWDATAKMRPELILVGFGLLQHGWQVVVPLVDYDTLARDVGSAEDRRRTEEMIHDLRVPVYDPRVVFARRCEATRELMAAWKKEKAGHDGLAFLRALHRVKPLVNALPPFWIKEV